jgi:hypothetical protein
MRKNAGMDFCVRGRANALLLMLAVCSMLAGVQGTGSSQGSIAIRHVTVVDVMSGEERAEQTVSILGNRIVSVSATAAGEDAAAGSAAIDGRGKYLIPGLWDMHVHATPELLLYVANGVTGIRIMSGERDEAAMRIELWDESPAPQIYLASAIVDGSDPVWPGSMRRFGGMGRCSIAMRWRGCWRGRRKLRSIEPRLRKVECRRA